MRGSDRPRHPCTPPSPLYNRALISPAGIWGNSRMAKRRPLVGIIMGSQSDWVTLRHAAETLDALGVAYESRIVSAHRTPKRMYVYAEGARSRGLKAIIAGAGGA